MEYKETIVPIGGMNSDDSYNVMPEGDYPAIAIGMRSGVLETGNHGAVENIMGTLKQNYQLNPLGQSTCMGWCRDYENNGYIYLVYNSLNYHRIIQYIPETSTFQTAQSSFFDFDINRKIYHADKIGDLLYWTDGTSPKKVNLAKAFSGAYGTIDAQIVDALKYPHVKSPRVTAGTDQSVKKNMLRGKLFQFAVRYVYDDYEKSCWSPISKVALPSDEDINGAYVLDISVNNIITIEVDTGHPIVRRIEIAAREGNTGDWALVERLDKYDSNGNILINSNNSYFYTFYNNKQKEGLDQTDVADLFDYMPLEAGTQAVIEKNMMTYGDITEGYDNVPLDIALSSTSELKKLTTSSSKVVNRFQSGVDNYDQIVIMFTDLVVGNVLTINIVNTDTGVNYTVVETYLATDSYTTFFNRVIAAIALLEYDPGGGVYYSATYAPSPVIPVTAMLLTIKLYDSSSLSDQTTTAFISQGNIKYKSWMPGWLEFGIIYYDRGNRSGAVNTGSGSPINIIDYSETTVPLTVVTDEEFVNTVSWQINNKPPSWATHYQWACFRRDSWSMFMDIPIHSITSAAGGFVEIDVNTTIVNINATNKKSVLGAYVWQKGDRIKFRKRKTPSGYLTTFDYIQAVVDLEINGQKATGEIVLDNFPYAYYAIGVGTIAKIYRPRKDLQQKVFFEFGEVGEIGDAGLPTAYHKKIGFTGQDQTALLPATGTFDSGDIYVKARWTPSFVYSCEAEEYSDWYDSKVTDIGRPNAIIQDMRQIRLQSDIRRGGVLIEGSKINGMSRFKVNDKIDLTAKYGSINRMVYRGFTLKVYQTYKVTPIYINRTSQTDVSGKESLVFSDKVMSIGNAPNEEWGTDLAGSVVVQGNSIFFFDRHTGQWIWDAGNGLIPINQKMNKEFFRLSKKGGLDIVAWVNEYEEILATYSYYKIAENGEQTRDKESVTLMYNIKDKRWKTYMPHVNSKGEYPEMYGGTDDTFVSWINGEIYLHNVGAYNFFYDKAHTQVIPIIANNGAKTDKLFQTIEVVSTEVFDSPTDGDIFIMEEDALPQGMQSRLKAGQYRWKEGKYVAGFMRDVTTPGVLADKIVNGRVLRGKVLCCKLHNDSDKSVVLKSVTIKGITSELNS